MDLLLMSASGGSAKWEASAELVEVILQSRGGAQARKVVELLLQAGADCHAKDDLRDPILTASAERADAEWVRLLLEYAADPNLWSDDYRSRKHTPLTLAALSGQVEIARLLVDAYADVNLRNGQASALIYASEGGHTEVARLLLQAGADKEQVKQGREGGCPATMSTEAWTSQNTHTILSLRVPCVYCSPSTS